MERSELIKLINDDKNIVFETNFLNYLKSESLIDFRNNVNLVQSINSSLELEDKVDKYYDELISQFNIDTQMFNDYNNIFELLKVGNIEGLASYQWDIFFMNSSLIGKLGDFLDVKSMLINDEEALTNYLLDISNKKLSEIIVDRLFKDNYYNVMINIREMIRYNQSLPDNEKILDNGLIKFYNDILNIDKISCNDRIKLYNGLKDKNISSMFYQQLRDLKDLSYKKMNNSMIKLNEHPDFKNKRLSKKYGLDIYDLRNQEYVMLISVYKKHNDETAKSFDCYSLISNENTAFYSDDNTFYRDNDTFIYGYNSFNPEYVVHVFENDSGTQDKKYDIFNSGSDKVNRVMSTEELITNDKEHNEINILNSWDEKVGYTRSKPDFLVVLKKITKREIEESKRLNIPIVVINPKVLEKKKENAVLYRDVLDDYTNNNSSFIEEKRRSSR